MIKPLNNYVLVEMEPEENKTEGGLYIPQTKTATAKDLLKIGKVIDKSVDTKTVEIDDRVYFNKHAITNIPNEEKLVFVRIEDLYGVIE